MLTTGGTRGFDAQRASATLVGYSLYAGFIASALASGSPGLRSSPSALSWSSYPRWGSAKREADMATPRNTQGIGRRPLGHSGGAVAADGTKAWIPRLILIVGVIALFFGLVQIAHAMRSAKWPQTTGKVSAAYVAPVMGTARGYYQPVIIYDYQVAARDYSSRRIKVIDSYSKQLTTLQQLVAGHPRGSSVVVYYDPVEPAFGVLVPGFSGSLSEYGLTITGAIMLVCGLAARNWQRKASG